MTENWDQVTYQKDVGNHKGYNQSLLAHPKKQYSTTQENKSVQHMPYVSTDLER